MDIIIKIIPRDQHRPEVDGTDWFFDVNGNLQVRLSPLGNWRQEALLGLHEAFEAVICKYQGITVESVDKFDQAYDAANPDRPDLNAGDETDAPYRQAHCYATAAERILAAALNVPWKEYDDNLATLYPGPSKKP